MGFVANFICFPALQKIENRLRFDTVTESLKVGTFLRHSVYMYIGCLSTRTHECGVVMCLVVPICMYVRLSVSLCLKC